MKNRPSVRSRARRRHDPLQIFGDVEISLVERERRDDSRKFGENRADLERYRLVDIKPWRHEDEVGAYAFGGDRWHCGVHAEFPRFVACGGDNAALARSADGNRFSAQIRIVALLDGGVESIHVDMDNLALPIRLVRDAHDWLYGFAPSPISIT